jgi:hypothetical protein
MRFSISAQNFENVTVKPISNRINTAFSEYNPRLCKDSTFYFTSLRSANNGDNENLFIPYWQLSIYQSKLTPAGFSKPEKLPKNINNHHYLNANFSINESQNHIIFSRCTKASEDKKAVCKLWESYKTNRRWSDPKPLPKQINIMGYHVTQAFQVELADYEILYFVANYPQGFGGTDLWYSIYKNGQYSQPVNLGSFINTSADEMTPFYDIISKRLYFSSEGHGGQGKMDVFYSEGALGQWSKPKNLGATINSKQNDIYFTINDNHLFGYFSSNRSLDSKIKSDTCCYDIFEFTVESEKEDTIKVIENKEIESIERLKLLLPLTLYFNNDEPNPRSTDTITTLNYQATLSDYLAKKTLFEQEYTKGLSGINKLIAKDRIARFFKDSVSKGFIKLELFSSYLLHELCQGKQLTIIVTAYASSLSKKAYNYNLTLRRIYSFKNYLAEYQDGVFQTYLKTKKLIIIAQPKGSEEAERKKISDNIQDKRNSVYGIEASLERKIQISEIIVGE